MRYETAETPIEAVFVGRELYVLCRDANVVQRFGAFPPPARVAARDAATSAGGTPALR
jgi:hypothetical protein